MTETEIDLDCCCKICTLKHSSKCPRVIKEAVELSIREIELDLNTMIHLTDEQIKGIKKAIEKHFK